MSNLIWIDNTLLFKIEKTFPDQYLCVCVTHYKIELGMEVGDYVFVRDRLKTSSYRRLGQIRAFNGGKVIISVMDTLGTFSRAKMERLHNESLEEETD